MPKIKSSRLIGPEDVKPGQYVTIAEVTSELVYLPVEACATGASEPRVAALSMMAPGAGWPFKVEQVCLPFVLVTAPGGERFPLDLRRHRLARLCKRYARAAFTPSEPAPSQAPAAS